MGNKEERGYESYSLFMFNVEFFLMILPPRPLKLPPRDPAVLGEPAMRFFRPCSTGNPIASVVLLLAFLACRLISVLESLIRNATSNNVSGVR